VGLRFRKSVKILPGVHLNVSKSGASLSLGRRGATVNLSTHGVRETVGIPGTGLSYSHVTPAPTSGRDLRRSWPDHEISIADCDRLGISSRPARTVLVGGGAGLALFSLLSSAINQSVSAGGAIELSGTQIAMALGIVPGLCLVLSGLMIPSRTTLFKKELARRLAEFDRAAGAIDLNDLAQVDAVLSLKNRLQLLDSEVDTAELTALRRALQKAGND